MLKTFFLVDTPSACGGVVHWAWSKVKAYLRQVKARTVDALYQALAQALDTISPAAMPYTLCDTQGKWLPKREMLYIIRSLSTVTSISWM
jgi:hypothetical protein